MIETHGPAAVCESVYGRDWKSHFQKMGVIRVEDLLAPLIRECGLKEAERQFPAVMRYLREASRDSGIVLPNPILTRLERPAARLNEKSVRELQHLTVLELAFLDALGTIGATVSSLLPAILFSAMRFGACSNPKKLHALMLALRQVPKRHQQHFWFELECDDIEAPIVWRPDALTLALLARWYGNHCHKEWETRMPLAPTYHRELARFFRDFGVWREHRLSVTVLMNAVSTRLSLDVPPILADCARGTTDNRPLKPTAFYRYITGKSPTLPADQRLGSPSLDQGKGWEVRKPPQGNPITNVRAEKDFWKATRRTLRLENNRNKACELIGPRLKAVRQELSPISQLMAEWVLHLLSTLNHWGGRLKPPSIGTQLSSILAGLRFCAGQGDCLSLSGSEWGEIYSQVIERKDSLASRQTTEKALAEFHHFLVSHYGASETDSVNRVPTGKRRLPHVDANLLLEEEFKAAFSHFGEQRQNASDERQWELNTCRLIALILGYRCGLRRSEVHWLTVSDIETGSEAELLLTGKRPVTLKTNSAYRRIPVYLLTTEREMSVICEWLTRRADVEADSNAPIFSLNEDHQLLIDSSELFDPIQAVMQVVTGDPNARFHHLRHSFGSRNFYHWMRPDLASPEEFDRVCQQRKRILNARTGTAPSRKAAKALHVMIGHASVEMTMTHYVHSAEWLLYEEMGRATPELSVKTLANLTGLTQRQIQRLSEGGAVNAMCVREHSSRKLASTVPELDVSSWQAPLKKKVHLQNKQRAREKVWILNLWGAVLVYLAHGTPVSELSERFNLKPEQLEATLWRHGKIMEMKYGTAGHDYYQHRLKEWSQEPGSREMFRFPHQGRDFELAVALVERYEALPMRQKPVVLWAINYFLRNGSARKARITFREKTSLKKFIRVLDVLGVHASVEYRGRQAKRPRFQLRLVMPEETDPRERKAAWEFWSKGLGLYSFQMRDKDGATSNPMGRIELVVLALHRVTKPKKANRRNHRPSCWGFRLGLYLIAMAYGWESESASN